MSRHSCPRHSVLRHFPCIAAIVLLLASSTGTAHAQPGEPVQLDVPASNPVALELARSHGLRPVFETARMYAGAAPALPIDRTFGITSFELG